MLQNALLHIANSKDAKLIYQGKKFPAFQLGIRSYEIVDKLSKLSLEKKRIAFCLPNSPELLCWMLACIHLGITIIPIMQESNPKAIEEILALIDPDYFFITSRKKNDLMEIRFPKQCKIEIIDDTYREIYKHIEQQTHLIFNPSRDLSKVDPKSLALIMLSMPEHTLKPHISSTIRSDTATPAVSAGPEIKGIMHSYQTAYSYIDMLYDVLAAREHFTLHSAHSLGDMNGLASCLATLLRNGTLILHEKFEVHDYLDELAQNPPTHLILESSNLQSILNQSVFDKKGFSQLQTCLINSPNLAEELPEQFHAKTDAPVQTAYGRPEAGIVTVNRKAWMKNPGSAGQKIPFTSIELRDAQNGYVKINDVGEIWIKSPALAQGYWNKSELTQQTFIGGWFRTGELALLDADGYYWYKGKKIEQLATQ